MLFFQGCCALCTQKCCFFSGILPSLHPKVLLFSRDLARSAPKSAAFFAGILLAPLFFDYVFLFGSMASTARIGQTPFMGRSCGPIRGIFFDVRKGGHIPPTPSSRPMSQRNQQHRRTTRIHIKKLSLQTRGRSTITRQQPHYITQINSRENFSCICNGTHYTN